MVSILLLTTLLLLVAGSIVAASSAADDLELRRSQTIILVSQGESAGATPSEMGELAALLNKAVELSEEAAMLTSPGDAQQRGDLLRQADEVLTTVGTKAAQLRAAASQRAFTTTVLMHVFGVIVAFVGTVAYAYGISFWRKYRVKRTFQMRISIK